MHYQRKHRLLALLLALAMLFSLIGTASADDPPTYPTYQEAYERIIALQSKYPEGTEFTNSTPYDLNHAYNWHGGSVKGATGGVGCAGFAFEASDAAFGNLPCRVLDQGEFTFEDIKVGDILRLAGPHFVIVLRTSIDGVIVAEGNYNKTVHWGRAISKAEVLNSSFIVTRYPANFVPSDAADANKVISSGTAGNLSWNVTNSGTLTISGNGAIPDFTANDRPSWEAYNDKIVTTVIDEGVTGIGSHAFSNSQAISISIPSSVQFINSDAFHQCTKLTSITLPEGLARIDERAFQNCIALRAVDLPSSLTYIGSGAFTSCEKLSQVRFWPSTGNLVIGDNLFTECWNLQFISLPNGITKLTPGLFSSCKIITYLYIPSTVTTLAEAGVDGPFFSSTVGTIYFGGTEAEWNTMMDTLKVGSLILTHQTLSAAKVFFEQTDPLVPDTSGTGGLISPCQNGHVGTPDADGNCNVCGQPMTPDTTGHQHSWSAEWTSNDTHHWHDCDKSNCPITDSSAKDSYGKHGWSNLNGICTICNATCQHQMDAATNTCAICGLVCTQHEWNAETGTCNICHLSCAHQYEEDGDICTICGAQKPAPPCDHVDDDGDGICDECDQPMPGAAHEETFASHSKTDFDPTGACQHEGCNYTLSQFQADCPTNHSTISTSSTCNICGATGTKTDSTVPDTPSNPSTPSIPSNPSAPSYPNYPYYPSTPTTPNRPSTSTGGNTNTNTDSKSETIPQPDGSSITITSKPDGSMTINTGKTGTTKVTIPTTSSTAGTVAIIVKANGSTEVIKTSVPTANGIVAPLANNTTVKIVDNRKYFADAPSNAWYNDAIAFVSSRELFSGTSPSTFSPETLMTRAMLMTVLARLDGVNTDGGTTWYANGMDWAMNRGISDGSNPNGDITREQLIVMLWRYCRSPVVAGSLQNFTDASQVNDYAAEAMRWAAANDIINGYSDGRLDPQGNATRAEVAQFLQNFIEHLTLGAT